MAGAQEGVHERGGTGEREGIQKEASRGECKRQGECRRGGASTGVTEGGVEGIKGGNSPTPARPRAAHRNSTAAVYVQWRRAVATRF